jgi:hypothetical protein
MVVIFDNDGLEYLLEGGFGARFDDINLSFFQDV